MRLNWLASLLLIFGLPAQAAQIRDFGCQRVGTEASCHVRLEGVVGASDRLFLSRVNDRDELLFRGHAIGSTGSFVGRDFHAGFFPRVYPLTALQGEIDPVLELRVSGGLMHQAGIPAGTKVKIIDDHYPLWKILGPAALQLLSFGFLAALVLYLIVGLRARVIDGWIYPRDELRWFVGGLGAYLLLRHEVSELIVPVLWPARTHLFAQRLALFTAIWSCTILLLGGRFSDRSCIERPRPRAPATPLNLLAHAALLFSLAAIASLPYLSEHGMGCLLGAPLTALLFAQGRAAWETEWRRVLKRSSLPALLFHVGLLALPLGVLLTAAEAWHGGAGSQRALEGFAWGSLLLGGLRTRAYLKARETSRELAGECRHILTRFSSAAPRLQAFCDFVADDWGAARVSVISVEGDLGLVLNSAGPDAIPEANRAEPRRLGPFLRRTCKRGQMLYAPVVEELGSDLRKEGLKHSSLAIPLAQDGRVRAVVCMMADEGERIPPSEATQLELLVDTLMLELLSAVGQSVSDDRNEHLLEIARAADALAVENLDHWGHVVRDNGATTRVMIGGDCAPSDPFFPLLKKSPVLHRAWVACRQETRSLWARTASSFEFIPKENRDEFWVVSPREFRNPLLRALGPERVGALLAVTLDRHARAVAAKDCYAVLGHCGVRLAGGTVSLRHGTGSGTSIEVDPDDSAFLHELLARALPGTVLFTGLPEALSFPDHAIFHSRTLPLASVAGRPIFSILSVHADKKELRRLESQAADKSRKVA